MGRDSAYAAKAGALDAHSGLLVLFATLEEQGLARVREFDVHCIASALAERWWPKFRFITKPTVYSPGLHAQLHILEREGTLDQLILVHDGWSPRHEYALTRIGRIRARDLVEKLETFGASTLHELRNDILSRAAKLVPENGEIERGNPSDKS
jgi:hypothetical protein